MSAAVWGEVANAALQVGSAWMNSDAQRAANRTNIKLQREQNAFDERMSNSAIQRRAADIEAAGGNRALAFTNGSEASTPVIAPARVEAPHFDAPRFNTAALLTKAQLDLTKSQTYKASAETESLAIDNKYKQAVLDGKIQYGQLSTAQDYEAKVNQNAKLKAEIAEITSRKTANDIANYIADSTTAEVIEQIKNGSLRTRLGLTGAENENRWQQVKKSVYDWLDKHAGPNSIDTGPFHPEMLPKDYR